MENYDITVVVGVLTSVIISLLKKFSPALGEGTAFVKTVATLIAAFIGAAIFADWDFGREFWTNFIIVFASAAGFYKFVSEPVRDDLDDQ